VTCIPCHGRVAAVVLPLVGVREGVPALGVQMGVGGFFEGGAGELEALGFGAEAGDAGGGRDVVEASGADVRDAVAVGVGAAWSWVPGDVGAEGVGGAEAGALTDEDEREAGVKEGADMVGDGDAGLGGDAERAKGLAGCGQHGEERGEERDGVVVDGGGGETVGEDDDEIAGGWVEESGGGGSEGSAEIGAAEIGGAVGCRACNGQDRGGQGRDLRAQAVGEVFGVECGVNGVTGLGVGELEVEDLCGGKTYAGATEGDPGWRVVA
jgi:hypothetical protein